MGRRKAVEVPKVFDGSAALKRNEVEEPKQRKRPAPQKLCVKCGESYELTEFYKNNGWDAQAYHDAWCKKCAKNFATTKEALREYCFYNNRAWTEVLWERSIESAKYALATDQKYVRAEPKRQYQLEEPIACSIYLSKMSLANNYTYSNNISLEDNRFPEYNPNAPMEVIEKKEEENMLDTEASYDAEWGGVFTKRDLEYLNNYYAELERDFALDDISMRDYAKKVAKASLLENIMYNKYRSGTATARELSSAKSNFDELSKSANFSACRRRTDDKTFIMPLGQVVEYLEINGKIKAPKEEWQQDRIDMMINEMWHIAASLGLDVGEVAHD